MTTYRTDLVLAAFLGSDTRIWDLVASVTELVVLIAALLIIGIRLRRGRTGSSAARAAQGRLRGAPVWLLCAVLVMVVGEAVKAMLPDPGWDRYPVPGDLILLLVYPLLGAGLVSLPYRRTRLRSVPRAVLDGLLILTAAATVSWFFVLGPALFHGRQPALWTVSHTVGTLFDLGLVVLLLAISARSARSLERRWMPVALAVGLVIISDALTQMQSLNGPGGLTVMAALAQLGAAPLLAVGALDAFGAGISSRLVLRLLPGRARRLFSDTSPDEEAPHVWNSLLPYMLVPGASSLAVYAWHASRPQVAGGVIMGAIVLAALAFCRQILAIQENLRLYEQARANYDSSLRQAEELKVLYDELALTRDQIQAKNDALGRLNLQLHAQATTDPLTGLPNHREMVVALDQELDRAHRYSRPCSFLFLDIDHFKALNDGCGHIAGDTVLREIVEPMVKGLRSVDIAGRWGGEEFVIILPETETADAVNAAERIRLAIEAHRFSVRQPARITCSVGVATYPYHAEGRDDLVDAADQAMYGAKRLGRNQVRAAVDPSVLAFMSEFRRSGSRDDITLWGLVEALAAIMEAHDRAEYAHGEQVAELAYQVSQAVGLSAQEARTVGLAGRLHDLGKIAVPQAILYKQGPLNSDEWLSILPHPTVGASVVSRVPALLGVAPLIRAHHEWWDGTGYPDGLCGDDIPIGSRIIAVCDAYSAMVSDRPHAPARPPDEALAELRECSGRQFDGALVHVLEQVLTVPNQSLEQAAV